MVAKTNCIYSKSLLIQNKKKSRNQNQHPLMLNGEQRILKLLWLNQKPRLIMPLTFSICSRWITLERMLPKHLLRVIIHEQDSNLLMQQQQQQQWKMLLQRWLVAAANLTLALRTYLKA